MAGVELGKLRSKAFARRAPVSAEVEQERAFAVKGARGAGIIDKANFGDECRNSRLC